MAEVIAFTGYFLISIGVFEEVIIPAGKAVGTALGF